MRNEAASGDSKGESTLATSGGALEPNNDGNVETPVDTPCKPATGDAPVEPGTCSQLSAPALE
jgi:hypothetical protein